MLKRLFSIATALFLAWPAQAAVPPIDQVQTYPREVPVKTLTPVFFSAKIASDAQHQPKVVRLLQLQWSGGEKEVAQLTDGGQRGDAKAGDGVYSCKLKMKEAVIGLISFRIEVTYKGIPVPVKSGPIFIQVIGGV